MKRLFVCVVLSGVLCSSGLAALLYTGGHADIGVAYEGGELHLHFHAEGAEIGGVGGVDGEFEPGEIIIVAPGCARRARPAGAMWDFLGVGESIWVLSEHAEHGDDHGHEHEAPFLGMGAEELAAGIFVNDQVRLSLAGVVGPGDFSVWQIGPLGEPVVFMASADMGGTVPLMLTAGTHGHFNWGFTAPGLYEVTLLVEGYLLDGTLLAESGVFAFQVVPEPTSLMLIGLGAWAAFRRRQGLARK